MFGDRFEPAGERARVLDLVAELCEVESHDFERRVRGLVEAVADFLEREAELAERQNLLQAGDVARV